MSYLFRNDTQEARSQGIRVAQSYGIGEEDYGYRLSSDLAAPFLGVAASINGAAMLAADAGVPILKATVGRKIDELFDTGGTAENWLEERRKGFHERARSLTPDPLTSSVVGHALGGLFEMGPQAIAGFLAGGPAGAAALVGGIQGNKAMQLAADQGVDPGTAIGMGLIQGGSAAIGAVMPMHLAPMLTAGFGAGTRVATNVAFGAVNQSAFGMASRGMTSDLLESRGYPDMAAQYKAMDRAAIAADIVLGGAFGAFGHGMAVRAERQQKNAPQRPPVRGEDLDTILTGNLQHHVELDTAPGLVPDVGTQAAHVDALVKATQDLLAGDPVSVGARVAEVEFLTNPQATIARQEIGQAISDHLGLPMLTDALGANSPERVRSNLAFATYGNETAISIQGVYHPARWVLVDAGDVQASMGKAENQFRNRENVVSQAQIESIANAPDWNQLNHAPLMDFGSPTMSRDGKIVGGNGRFEGLSRAYERGKAEGYREALDRNLSVFGFDPGASLNMKRPVLMRVLETNISTERAAIASNQGTLKMSQLELAKQDAGYLPDLSVLRVGENGEISAAANDGLISMWTRPMPITEGGSIRAGDGKLSQEGMVRLRNAILYKAYGDSPTLARLVESLDPGSRNVAAALIRSAAKAAKAQEAIAAGEMYPIDIMPDVMAAAEKLEQLRAKGEKVADYLAQGDMFAVELSIEARKILQFFGDHMKSAKAMSDLFNTFWTKVEAAGNPKQGSMLGEAAVPTKAQVLDAALAETRKVLPPPDAELPFGNAPAEPAAGRPTPADHLAAENVIIDAEIQKLTPDAQAILRQMYQRAAELKNSFDDIGAQVAREVGGTLKAPELKGSERAVAKISSDYKGDPTGIKDLLRATIEVDSVEQARAAVVMLRERFQVLEQGFRDLFDPEVSPVDGYRDAKMNIQLDGIKTEMQVNLPEMLKAKKQVHKLYEQRSAIERAVQDRGDSTPTAEEQAKIDALNAEMKPVYDAAFEVATNAKNLGLESGAPLRLADSGSNLRGGSSSQAAQYGKEPPALMETGTPSTSKNSALGENSNVSTDNTSTSIVREPTTVVKDATAEGDTTTGQAGNQDLFGVRQILTEKPDLRIMDEAGQAILARDALARADEEIAIARRESQAYDAAVACALRG